MRTAIDASHSTRSPAPGRNLKLNDQEDLTVGHRSLVIGIAGGSASGKTTFTAALEKELAHGDPALTVEAIGMDRYFYRGQTPGPVFVSPSTGETLPDNNHPDSADNARLAADMDARRSAPDAPQVILVEGLMALHVPAVRERC